MLIDFRSQQFSVDTPGEMQTQGALDDGPATEQPHWLFHSTPHTHLENQQRAASWAEGPICVDPAGQRLTKYIQGNNIPWA